MSDGVDTSTQEFARYGSDARSDFITGVVMVVGAVIAIAVSIYQSGIGAPIYGPATAPRLFSLALALVGAGLVMRKINIRNPQDFYGGVMLIALAVIALLASMSLQGMRGFAFGPATAPRLFATLLGALGGIVVIMGLITNGPQLERFTFRAPLFVIGSVLIFAACIRPLGLVIACFLTILSSAAATTDTNWKETLIWAVILTTFCAILFPYGLALPFQLWPRFWY